MAWLSRIAPEIPVSTFRDSIDYYVRQLGFELAMEMPDGGYVIVERDGVAIHLCEDGNRTAVGVHIFCEGLEAMLEAFMGRGALITQVIERKPWGNREFRVKDLFGNEGKFAEAVDQLWRS